MPPWQIRTDRPGSPMSALGQKQTCAAHKLMSALVPKATAKADFRTRPCLLYTQYRTCAVQLVMSASIPHGFMDRV
jgi:hypothetical protein